MQTNLEEDELLEGLNRRDEQAMQKFHGLFFRRMCSYTNLYTRKELGADEIKDIANDAFTYSMKRKNKFKSIKHAQRSIYKAIEYVAKDFFKKRNSKKSKLKLIFGDIDLLPGKNYILDNLTKTELIHIIYMEIKKLHPNDTQLFKWVYFDDLPNEEIAARLNIKSQSAINQKIKLAAKIKVILIKKDLYLIFLIAFIFV